MLKLDAIVLKSGFEYFLVIEKHVLESDNKQPGFRILYVIVVAVNEK
jgi:hypothetical protein